MEDTTSVAVDSSVATEAPSGVTSAEPSAATPSPRPASMREALEQTAAKASAATGDAATTVPPATADVPAKAPGPIPFDVHKTALENARTKATEEAAGQWKDYEWVRQVPATDLREFADMVIQAKGDPIAVLSKMAEQIAADPVHGPALRSFSAKQLAAGRTAQPDAEPSPDVAIDDGQGGIAGYTYSAKQLALRDAWREKRLMEAVDQRFAPIVQSHKDAVAKQQTEHAKAEATTFASEFGAELSKYQGFTEHKADIGQKVLAELQKLDPRDPRGNDPSFLQAITLRAYHSVVGPKLPALIQAQHLASLKQKAVASQESPSRTASSSGQRPRNPAELAKFMAQRAAERRG